MRSVPRPTWARPRWVALFGVLAGGVLLLAACGGSPVNGNGAVAHLGSTTTTKAPSSQGNSAQSGDSAGTNGGSGPGGGVSAGQMALADPNASQSQLVAFAHCMQTHGVPSFPDPNAQGVISGINRNAPGFQAASNECSHLLPNGGRPTPAQEAQAASNALKFSQCMRAHGIVGFPDPQILNGGAQIRITIGAGKGGDMNPQNPQFQAAQRKCQGFLPFKGAHRLSTNGGPK